ncbi:hypothetical protein M9H77_36682 [Catharanthus roseus]|uniref:Uncharacterized protein n=1 Tax=Catharanthus roseus TaxID=4058 RepID=A0ACB9ZSH0_CATRO|nr:hypothetical protein M9H77_36682 [Catharanthus roseus]
MYKNQLQEFAQRTCINLPSYSSIREGPDHAPRFKVKVNFDGEFFESPKFCSTLRQAEHAAAEVALKTLSQRGPSRALATRVLVFPYILNSFLSVVISIQFIFISSIEMYSFNMGVEGWNF